MLEHSRHAKASVFTTRASSWNGKSLSVHSSAGLKTYEIEDRVFILNACLKHPWKGGPVYHHEMRMLEMLPKWECLWIYHKRILEVFQNGMCPFTTKSGHHVKAECSDSRRFPTWSLHSDSAQHHGRSQLLLDPGSLPLPRSRLHAAGSVAQLKLWRRSEPSAWYPTTSKRSRWRWYLVSSPCEQHGECEERTHVAL